ncbi:hypothetical protein DPX39_090034600 [Trypanosoma brucei equiperdum]|uniref:Uncharacterized protein n=1 Tax=Trypanosoma brucei equiperdum TaxID=630700 RepID=A0A3L6L6L7_9TRYP|nr:hypothetical protein DPX39_090034600 [Trypanosoma brucei equiperdum]
MTPTVTPLQLPKREGVKPFPDAPLGGAAVEPHALPPKPRTRASSVNDGRKKTTSSPSYMNPLKLPTKAIVWTNKPPVKPNKISVSLENFEDAPRIKGVFNSPRSLKACEIAVVDPRNLLKRPLSHFEGKGVPETLAQMRHTYYENRRKTKLEEVRRIRDGLPVEVPQEKEDEQTNVNGRTPSVNNGHRAPLLRERSPPPMVRQRTPMRRSTSFGFCSRSSSSAPYKVGGEKPYPPSRRTTLHGADGRSPSVGALKVLNRAMSENRSLSAADYDMLRRIEEREERANEARQRAEEMEAARERELLERGLRKELHGINKLIERENERISAVQMRRQKLEMRLQQARERQKRSEEERLGQWNAKR